MQNETSEMLAALHAFGKKMGLGEPFVCSDYPIVRLSSHELVIDFLYGPPEFHIEMALRDPVRPDGRAVSLGDLFSVPSVRQWAESHRLTSATGKPSITYELEWHCKLLVDTCGELFTSPAEFLQRYRK